MKYTCALCGRIMALPESNINGDYLCHPDEGRDCYTEVQRINLEEGFAVPQRFIVGGSK